MTKMGRYVDLSQAVTFSYYDEEREEWRSRRGTIEDLLDDLCDSYTTTDAVPVKHGRWVTDGIVMDDGEFLMTRCTACGTPYEYGYDMPYCPHCGAKMDGEDET